MRLVLLAAALAGCQADSIQLAQTGYVWIELPIPVDVPPGAVQGVEVAGVPVAGIRVEQDRLEILPQGAPLPGPADAVLALEGGEGVTLRRAVTYLPAADGFERLAAVGASLSMGAQGGAITARGQLVSPSMQIARSAGAYFPAPVVVDELMRPIAPDDIGPPPSCKLPSLSSFLVGQGPRLLQRLRDPDTGIASYRQGRVSPELTVHNLAAAGSRVVDLAGSPRSDDFGVAFSSGLVYALDQPFGVAPTQSQLDILEPLDPTVVICTDLFGNDIVGGISNGEWIDVGGVTPEAELLDGIDAVVERLVATGAQVFVPTLPRPTLLPATLERTLDELAEVRDQAERRGEDPGAAVAARAEQIELRLQEILRIWELANARVTQAAAAYDTVHLVDLAREVDRVAEQPPVLNGEQLGLGKFEGLLSTDGLHFGDVGYALVAGAFVEVMERELGIELEPVDLEQVHAADPFGPGALRDAGFAIDECEAP